MNTTWTSTRVRMPRWLMLVIAIGGWAVLWMGTIGIVGSIILGLSTAPYSDPFDVIAVGVGLCVAVPVGLGQYAWCMWVRQSRNARDTDGRRFGQAIMPWAIAAGYVLLYLSIYP